VPLASDANAKRKEVEATAMLERIISYLSEQLDIPAEEMNRNTTFESLHLDSLDMVEMVMDMEEELGVDFEMDGKLEVNTIGELADLIEEKLSEIG
jgi:acyl carrier protein